MPAPSISEGRSLPGALFRARQINAPCLWAAALLLSVAPALADTWQRHPGSADCFKDLIVDTGRIDRITDGDTVVLQDNRRVRLIGINTLELNEQNRQLRNLATNAHQALAALLSPGEPVLLYVGSESHDRHKRVLAHVVRASDELAVSKVLLEQGLAMQSAVAPNTLCADFFSTLEINARENAYGLWQADSLLSNAATSINKKSRGFKLITGTVTHVKKQARNTQLTLDNRFTIRVRSELANALHKTRALTNLEGKTVEIRGWLSRSKNRTQLWLQHPANLRILEP